MTISRLALLLALAAGMPACADSGFMLRFPANPSTGHHWVLNQAQSTGLDLVTIEDKDYGPPGSNLIGAPAPALFAVTCTGSGAVRLVFDYTAPDGATVAESRAAELTCD